MSCAVVDVGKTHAKVSVVEPDGRIAAHRRTTNATRHDGPYPHADVDALDAWIAATLRELHRSRGFDRIICTTHGAAAALVAGDRLALPVMDYEWTGLPDPEAKYESARDGFSTTLSPSLPCGLNLARQIHWQSCGWPAEYATVDRVLLYPQYWAWRLCGESAAEVSSLGSHSDLWRPLEGAPSGLARRLGVASRLPPLRGAAEVLGRLDPQRFGFPARAAVDVHCGVHDSSAAYVAMCPDVQSPGVVVSTGTWVVCMAPLADPARLDPRRDTSGTVSVFGRPLACSRFMGGREYAALAGSAESNVSPTEDDLERVLAGPGLAVPPFANGGPFQHRATPGHVAGEAPATPAERRALAALYCALVTDACLALIDAQGPIVVDGPFATNALYLGVLAALRPEDPVLASDCADGPTLGAARLAFGRAWCGVATGRAIAPLHGDAVREYRRRWQAALGQAG
jgi:L-fuculokinase